MINSDNYQAINLLLQGNTEKVDCIYIDPPYNTDASKILYKNGYEQTNRRCLRISRGNLLV
jgi:adenine-specific DNA-methyltransferase